MPIARAIAKSLFLAMKFVTEEITVAKPLMIPTKLAIAKERTPPKAPATPVAMSFNGKKALNRFLNASCSGGTVSTRATKAVSKGLNPPTRPPIIGTPAKIPLPKNTASPAPTEAIIGRN